MQSSLVLAMVTLLGRCDIASRAVERGRPNLLRYLGTTVRGRGLGHHRTVYIPGRGGLSGYGSRLGTHKSAWANAVRGSTCMGAHDGIRRAFCHSAADVGISSRLFSFVKTSPVVCGPLEPILAVTIVCSRVAVFGSLFLASRVLQFSPRVYRLDNALSTVNCSFSKFHSPIHNSKMVLCTVKCGPPYLTQAPVPRGVKGPPPIQKFVVQ